MQQVLFLAVSQVFGLVVAMRHLTLPDMLISVAGQLGPCLQFLPYIAWTT